MNYKELSKLYETDEDLCSILIDISIGVDDGDLYHPGEAYIFRNDIISLVRDYLPGLSDDEYQIIIGTYLYDDQYKVPLKQVGEVHEHYWYGYGEDQKGLILDTSKMKLKGPFEKVEDAHISVKEKIALNPGYIFSPVFMAGNSVIAEDKVIAIAYLTANRWEPWDPVLF